MVAPKVHTTNYFNTLIEVSDDSQVTAASAPKSTRAAKTIAEWQYERLSRHPYKFTSDELLFDVYALRNNIPESEREAARMQFFSKGQACLRTSPLAKNFGFGIHADANGKLALIGCETAAYKALQQNPDVRKHKAMRSARKH